MLLADTIDNSKIIEYQIETFAFILNVDETVLRLNQFIENFGYEFICLNLNELEKKFGDVFHYNGGCKTNVRVTGENKDEIILSKCFINNLNRSSYFGSNVFFSRKAFMLKMKEDTRLKVIDGGINFSDSSGYAAKIQSFVEILIHQLKLFKKGDISCPIEFQIDKHKRNVTFRATHPLTHIHGRTIFCIKEAEIKEFEKVFKFPHEKNILTELAINNFILSYEISDIKTRFITLMTCLESLFNLGKDQISHTVSRHLAIIISNSIEEFHFNYKKIKQLYGIRSQIVHGGKVKENLHSFTDELQDLVRIAIRYCQSLDLNKEQLFNYLNAKGFEH